MKITSSAVSLNVEDVAASSAFLVEHFGFHEQMAAPGFSPLTRDDAGINVEGRKKLGMHDLRHTFASYLILELTSTRHG